MAPWLPGPSFWTHCQMLRWCSEPRCPPGVWQSLASWGETMQPGGWRNWYIDRPPHSGPPLCFCPSNATRLHSEIPKTPSVISLEACPNHHFELLQWNFSTMDKPATSFFFTLIFKVSLNWALYNLVIFIRKRCGTLLFLTDIPLYLSVDIQHEFIYKYLNYQSKGFR